MAPRRRNKTNPKPSMLTNQRNKLKALKLEAPPARIGGPTYGPGSGVTGRPSTNILDLLFGFARRNPYLATAGTVVASEPLGDGTLRGAMQRGDYKPQQGPRNPDQGLNRAQSFDKAFAAARKAGKAEFTWNGKRYNTRMAGE
jgi:hypothetical protein